MKNMKKSPVLYLILLFVALASLAITTVSAVRATPLDESEEYTARMISSNIGVTLQEGDADKDSWKNVAWRNYDTDHWDPEKGVMGLPIFEGLDLTSGTLYEDDFRVLNSGTIDEYVRVIVYKHWLSEKDGELVKDTDLDASLIQLSYAGSSNWVKDTKYSTSEKEIWYYTKPLAAAKKATADTPASEAEVTDVLINGIKLDGEIKNKYTKDEIVTQTEDETGTTTYTTITYDYEYNGKTFKIMLEVDGVQIKHAEDAILSAWGRKGITVNGDGSLSISN